jgi:hypothetical protein
LSTGTWWDEGAWLHLLRTSVNPARLGLLRDAVAAVGLQANDAKALDVGCDLSVLYGGYALAA